MLIQYTFHVCTGHPKTQTMQTADRADHAD